MSTAIEPKKGEMAIVSAPHALSDIQSCLPAGITAVAGDTKLIWDANNSDEVDAARSTFEKLTKKGYLAFRAEGDKGTKGGKLNSFDAGVERMILTPPVKGG